MLYQGRRLGECQSSKTNNSCGKKHLIKQTKRWMERVQVVCKWAGIRCDNAVESLPYLLGWVSPGIMPRGNLSPNKDRAGRRDDFIICNPHPCSILSGSTWKRISKLVSRLFCFQSWRQEGPLYLFTLIWEEICWPYRAWKWCQFFFGHWFRQFRGLESQEMKYFLKIY